MGTCHTATREVRFVLDDAADGRTGQGLLHCYVATEAWGDCPHMVGGWTHKAFDADTSTLDVLNRWAKGEENPLLWPACAPQPPARWPSPT
jgi:hypothetical protein